MVTAREDATGFAALVDDRARIADRLLQYTREVLGDRQGYLAETTAHVLATPGKLLRPLLLLDACRAAGGDPEVVFPAACGTEFGHVASLVHDDIIDDDYERRGRESLHAKYGLGAAILTGDLLIFQTFLSYTECTRHGASAERVLAAIRVLSQTCIEMCQGQALEESLTGHLDTSEDAYFEVVRLKTASVCAAAARIGAQLGGATDGAVITLGNYGQYLGMAFQIVDDLLCYIGDDVTVGKSLASDMRNQRITLPVIYALQTRDRCLKGRIRALLAAGASAEARAELLHVLNTTRALERTRAVAYRFTTKAKQELDRLPYTEARERLRALVEVLYTRDH